MAIPQRITSRSAGRLIAGMFCALLLAGAQSQAQELDYDEPWIMPFDIDQHFPDDPPPLVSQQSQVYDFMWRTFVALNWLQLDGGARAEPDPSQDLAPWDDADQSQGPVVWQSYLRPNEVFVKPKEWPLFWNDPPVTPQPVCPPAPLLEPSIVNSFSTNYSDNSDGLNQPFIQANYATGPVIDQNGNYLRYEVGLNQAYFTYIGHFRYYDARRQKFAVERYIDFVKENGVAPDPSNSRHAKYFQPLPNGTEAYLQNLPDYALQGMVEWKAAWKILGGDDVPERFYRRFVYFLNPDGSCTGPFLAGLVALHIHRVTRSLGHIGTTFEQVDNTQLQPDYSAAQVAGAAALPPHASLNPGGEVSPIYPNGYEVCDSDGNNCESGKAGILPELVKDGETLPLDPPITNVVRQAPIPDDVQETNAAWREKLAGSVFFYYQMIGAQNANIDEPNPNLGPGVRGAQVSSTNQLINTALESYTQRGWSCALCHQNASPLGVSLPLPPFQEEYDALHTISFLLQNAQRNGKY